MEKWPAGVSARTLREAEPAEHSRQRWERDYRTWSCTQPLASLQGRTIAGSRRRRERLSPSAVKCANVRNTDKAIRLLLRIPHRRTPAANGSILKTTASGVPSNGPTRCSLLEWWAECSQAAWIWRGKKRKDRIRTNRRRAWRRERVCVRAKI